MPKTLSLVAEPPPQGRAIRRLQTVLLCLFAIGLSVPLYEISKLSIASWQGMYGPVPRVETPILDAIRARATFATGEVHAFIVPIFTHLPWKPQIVLPLAFLWTGFAALMLRRN